MSGKAPKLVGSLISRICTSLSSTSWRPGFAKLPIKEAVCTGLHDSETHALQGTGVGMEQTTCVGSNPFSGTNLVDYVRRMMLPSYSGKSSVASPTRGRLSLFMQVRSYSSDAPSNIIEYVLIRFCWKKPPEGTFKASLDASWKRIYYKDMTHHYISKAGCVIRNSGGAHIDGFWKELDAETSPLAEAQALEATINFARKYNYLPIIIEMDNIAVINKANGVESKPKKMTRKKIRKKIMSMKEPIYKEVRNLVVELNLLKKDNVQVVPVYREANQVAHKFAEIKTINWLRNNNLDVIRNKELQGEIQTALEQDREPKVLYERIVLKRNLTDAVVSNIEAFKIIRSWHK